MRAVARCLCDSRLKQLVVLARCWSLVLVAESRVVDLECRAKVVEVESGGHGGQDGRLIKS